MTRLVFSPAAQADIEEIYDYTLDQWGLAQAEYYVREIANCCTALASSHKQGRDAGYIRQGYFNYRIGSHFVFYNRSDVETVVIRILHQIRDFDRHFVE